MTGSGISSGSGTPDDPWRLETPPLSSDYTMHRDTRDGVDVIVCTVGKTVLLYDARCADRSRTQPAQQPHARGLTSPAGSTAALQQTGS